MLTLKCQQEALSTATALLSDEYPPYIGIKVEALSLCFRTTMFEDQTWLLC